MDTCDTGEGYSAQIIPQKIPSTSEGAPIEFALNFIGFLDVCVLCAADIRQGGAAHRPAGGRPRHRRRLLGAHHGVERRQRGRALLYVRTVATFRSRKIMHKNEQTIVKPRVACVIEVMWPWQRVQYVCITCTKRCEYHRVLPCVWLVLSRRTVSKPNSWTKIVQCEATRDSRCNKSGYT